VEYVKVVKRVYNCKVDLLPFSERIKRFFKSRGFEASIVKLTNGYLISVRKSFTERLRVRIIGNPGEFLVELSTEEGSDASIMFGGLTTIFGGGGLFLRGIRSRELLEKLESDFFSYVEGILQEKNACRI
jgi:hypothetical protein